MGIFHAAEAIGVLPDQLMDSFIALMPKPTGGLRPIAWCQTLARIWMKARYHVVRSWEVKHTHALPFAAQKFRGPTDVVWRHAFKSEGAQAGGGHFACLLWDLLKCYELVGHNFLQIAAMKYQYPVAILRVCIALYRAPRRILLNGLVSRPITPTRGILAGVSTATSELRLVLLDMVKGHVQSHPCVALNVFVDNIVLDSTSDSRTDVVENIKAAADDLLVELTRINLTVAKQKAAVISNCCSTASSLRRLLGDLGGPKLSIIRSLGIDFGERIPRLARPGPSGP